METNPNDILAELEASHEVDYTAPPEASGASAVPEGKGILLVENAYLAKTKNGRAELRAKCKVLEHDVEGAADQSYTKRWGLTTTKNWQWLKRDLHLLGLAIPSKPQDLRQTLDQLIGIKFKVTFVDNPGYPPAAYINEGARVQ